MAMFIRQQLAPPSFSSSFAPEQQPALAEPRGAATELTESYDSLAEAFEAHTAAGNSPHVGKNTGRKASKRKQNSFKVKLCRYFAARRGCRKGDACEFAHGEDEVTPKPAGQLSQAQPLWKRHSLQSKSETTCSSPSSTSRRSFIFSTDEDDDAEGAAQLADELVSSGAGAPWLGAVGGAHRPPRATAGSLRAAGAHAAGRGAMGEVLGLEDDSESDGVAQWANQPPTAARGKTPPLRLHYSLNFAGAVAKLRTKNTFLEFEDEEPQHSSLVALRRRGSSAPPALSPSGAGTMACGRALGRGFP